MEYVVIILACALVFGLLFLLDKGFTRLFRNKAQHKSGLSVRLHMRYCAFGLILAAVGVAAIFAGMDGSWLLLGGGILLILLGAALVVYYMSFGVFYDEDTFLVMSIGKKQRVYHFGDIRTQQLFNNAGNILIELHMADGTTLMVHGQMDGVFPFLDKAFAGWLRQTGRQMADCPFSDPSNSCWFPTTEE